MKVLVVTQAVDRTDPVLGFFHRWLEEFAARSEAVTVICLKKGAYDLPANVAVFSLGKEERASRWRYLRRLFRFAWQRRNDYDVVFVHMNQEYVLLCGWLWRLLGKRILLWRNHAHGTWLTALACRFAHRVLYTSPRSYTARCANATQLPAGIDTVQFQPDATAPKREPRTILSLGRIAPVKRLELLIEALHILRTEGERCTAHIVGSPAASDQAYAEELAALANRYALHDAVTFHPGIAPAAAAAWYWRHAVFVNLTPPGSFDKTVVEALAAGCTVVTRYPECAAEPELLVETEEPAAVARALRFALAAGPDPARQERARQLAAAHDIAATVQQILALAR